MDGSYSRTASCQLTAQQRIIRSCCFEAFLHWSSQSSRHFSAQARLVRWHAPDHGQLAILRGLKYGEELEEVMFC
jgi:hypothetical protein